MICKGYGECLEQTDDLKGYISNPNCPYECRPVPCPNFKLCNKIAPFIILDCHDGLCSSCDIEFGRWQGGKGKLTTLNDECPICLEDKECISLPKCDHFICIDCFQNCWSINHEIDNPPFPYSEEIYEEWLANESKWATDIKIQKWIFDCEIIEDKNEQEYLTKKHLRKCPLCRK